jgi:hypothetical protein
VSKVPPPVLGYNNNVRHRGRVFHIQTEDSGVKNPRIVTHLFADGGRIIKTTRTEYSQHLAAADVTQTVRQLMKAQHKAMFVALRMGELDAVLEAACGPLPESAREVGTATPSRAPADEPSSGAISIPAFVSAAPAESGPPAQRRTISNPALRKLVPSVPPPSAEALDSVVSGLEPASATLRVAPKSEPPRSRKSQPSARKLRTSTPLTGASERASVSRPASRYGSVPSKSARSIFGDGVISEKSLDGSE